MQTRRAKTGTFELLTVEIVDVAVEYVEGCRSHAPLDGDAHEQTYASGQDCVDGLIERHVAQCAA